MSKAPDCTPWDGIIVTNQDVCFGKVRIAGTRHYIDYLLARMKCGKSFDDLLKGYPDLKRYELKAMMGCARDLVAAKRNRLKGEFVHG